MKIKLAVFLVLLAAMGGSTFAQGVRYSSTVTQQGTVGVFQNIVTLPANPVVKFCQHPANAVPCSNLATTYTDQTLATPCAGATQIVRDGTTTCVASPDAQDNWGVWVAPNSAGYDYTITIGSTSTGPFNVLSQTTTHSGAETFTGAITCTIVNVVACISPSNPQGWAGTDVGGWLNSAYASLPANGGVIQIAAGSYSFSTPVVFGTANKPVIVQGAGYGTQLTYTPTTGTAFTFNYGPGVVANHPRGAGLRDVYIIGPNSGTATGILLGGTNGAEGFKADGIYISSFNQDVVYGNNTWATTFSNSIIRHAATNLLSIPSGLTNSGESLSFVGVTFIQDGSPFANAIVNNFGGATIDLSNCSVDDSQIVASAGVVQASNLHMEWLTAQSAAGVVSTGGWIKIANMNFSNDVAGTTAPSVFSMSGGGQIEVANIQVTSVTYVFPAIAALSGAGGNFTLTGLINTGNYTTPVSLSAFTGTYFLANRNATDGLVVEGNGTDTTVNIRNDNGGVEWTLDSLSTGNLTIFPKTGSGLAAINAIAKSKTFISDQGTACTNGELALSAGWQSTGTATVTAVAGNGQTCQWTITTGTTTAANPTVTDTLTTALPAATTVCEMNIHGGTHTAAAGEGFTQTALSATAPVFTFIGTPTAGGTTYFVTRRCGP